MADEGDIGLQLVTERYLKRRATKRMAPFTVEWMLGLHKEIFGRAWHFAGTIRPDRPRFGVPSGRVRLCLSELADNIHAWAHDPVEASADLHSEAVRIHPFADGNGRWARLMANIYLRQETRKIVMWPIDVRKPNSKLRNAYLDAIEASVERMDYGPLYSLHRRFAIIPQ